MLNYIRSYFYQKSLIIQNNIVIDEHFIPILEDSHSIKRMEELEGLRALACILVLIAHFGIPLQSKIFYVMRSFFPAQLAILLFFTMSSFLLTNMIIQEYEKTHKIQYSNFLVKRCFRIWPLYFFIILLTICWPSFKEGNLTDLEFNIYWNYLKQNWDYLVFIGNWFPQRMPEFGILWSICIEEQFYLLLPLVLSVIITHSRLRLYYLIGIILLGYCWRIYVSYYLKVDNTAMAPLYYLTPTYIDCFAFGALAAWVYRTKHFLSYSKSTFSIQFIFLTLTIACYFAKEKLWWAPYSGFTVFSYGLVPLFFGYLILFLLSNKQNIISIFLRSKIMKTIGVLSFGVYLWHVLILHRILLPQIASMKLKTFNNHELIYLLLFTEYLILCIFFSALTFKIIELPFLKIRGWLYDKSQGVSIQNSRWDLQIGKILFSCAFGVVLLLCYFRIIHLI